MMAVSMGCNWLYLSSFSKTLGMVVLLSAGSVAVDILKALAPFWLSEAWKKRQFGQAGASLVVLVVAITISLASAIGFLAEMHSASVGGRSAVTEHYEEAAATLKDLRTQLSKASTARAVEVVEQQILALRQEPRWASTEGCTKDTVRSSREFCRELRALEVEIVVARQAKELRGQIAEVAKKVETLKAMGGGTDADPRASLIGRMTGLAPPDVNYAIELCFAVLVEFSAAFGLFLAFEGARGGQQSGSSLSGQRPLLEVVKSLTARAGAKRVQPRRIRFGGRVEN
jgi:hypothetical protein